MNKCKDDCLSMGKIFPFKFKVILSANQVPQVYTEVESGGQQIFLGHLSFCYFKLIGSMVWLARLTNIHHRYFSRCSKILGLKVVGILGEMLRHNVEVRFRHLI